MTFYAYHGVLKQERIVGNDYIVDLKLSLNLKKACQSDLLEDTIDYGSVYRCIADEMKTPSLLIEHLAERICQHLRQDFDMIQTIEIHLKKCHPPVDGLMESAEVVLIR